MLPTLLMTERKRWQAREAIRERAIKTTTMATIVKRVQHKSNNFITFFIGTQNITHLIISISAVLYVPLRMRTRIANEWSLLLVLLLFTVKLYILHFKFTEVNFDCFFPNFSLEIIDRSRNKSILIIRFHFKTLLLFGQL